MSMYIRVTSMLLIEGNRGCADTTKFIGGLYRRIGNSYPSNGIIKAVNCIDNCTTNVSLKYLKQLKERSNGQ